MEKQIVTLDAEQAIGQLVVSGTEQQDKNGDPYYRARYMGIGFILRPDVYEDWKAGDVHSMTLISSKRDATDSEGNTTPVDAWEYGGHITGTQKERLVTNKVTIQLLERKLLAKAPVVDDVMDLA